jgi:para-aminobenzoate synthetase component 1
VRRIRAFGARTEEWRDRNAGPGWETIDGDVLSVIEQMLGPLARDALPGLPPFQGGAAGFLGYEFGGVLERLPPPRPDLPGIPDAVFGLYDWTLAWDHERGAAWLISTGIDAHGRESAEAAAARAEGVLRMLASPPAETPSGASCTTAMAGQLRSTFTRDEYLAAVQRVRDYILSGDVFQVNLSQRFEAPFTGDPLALYASLRAETPAPFAGYLDAGDFQLVSASPERFLLIDGDRIETRPIKGTRPRGTTPELDEALAAELAGSAKDRAENVMIVDLLRNDLSRVCRPGTVRATALLELERHPTVHHLVSTVEGRVREGVGGPAALRAAFPGGSITGAPKVRAMEIIAELEPEPRGPYCGSMGYLSLTGAMDTSILIRTCVVQDGRVRFGAGGGIVADSDPAAEYAETLDKARALIAATGARSP